MIQPSPRNVEAYREPAATYQRSCEELLATYAASHDPALRTCIIERHEQLARSLARRFARPGVPVEDLAQSARMALIGAVDRFDPTHRTKFSTYAVTCMVGEIKRYFRDRTWAVKVPRRLQEISATLVHTQDRLYGKLQREPTVGEMAAASDTTEEEILQAMEVGNAYQPLGLDDHRQLEDGGDAHTLGETVGAPDTEIERMVEQAPLQAALGTLDARMQQIIRMRFTGECSQQEVADALGLSQMHISRLERRALKELRAVLAAGQP